MFSHYSAGARLLAVLLAVLLVVAACGPAEEPAAENAANNAAVENNAAAEEAEQPAEEMEEPADEMEEAEDEAAGDTEAMEPATYDVTFLDHIEAELPEQDVFVESADDPEMVMRVGVEDGSDPDLLAADVYAAADTVHHDPFMVGDNPLGPFPKGEALGFTLDDWLSASGSGTYAVDADGGQVDFTFEGLVPEGVYTLWCSKLKMPPEPDVVDAPCGAADGSENTFTADADGNGAIALDITPLEPSQGDWISAFAIAYHSDGNTYGAEPGDFGSVTHVHLFWMLPGEEADGG